MQVWSLAQEGPVEEGMATYSSILAFLPMGRGAWKATVYRVTKSPIDWSDLVKWHNYQSPCASEPVLRNKRSHCNNAWAPQLEKAHEQQRRPSIAKNN